MYTKAWIKFDLFHPKYHTLSEEGTRFKGTKICQWSGAASEEGWSSGVHSFSIKCISTKCPDHAGSIRSGDNGNGTPAGLFEPDQVFQRSGNPWNWPRNGDYGEDVADELSNFPAFYNPHDPAENEFLVINPGHPVRPVTNYSGSNNRTELYRKVNRISRNLVEDMAERAREEGIYVFTLGLGSRLTEQTGPDNERGEDILYRMANDPRMLGTPLAGDFKSDQLQGVYCHAIDEYALAPCFDTIVSTLVRLTN